MAVETLSRIKEAPRRANAFLGRAGNTIASHLVLNGTDLGTVNELFGHKSIQMTVRWAHLSQAHKKKAVDTLTGMMYGHFLDTKAKKVDTLFFETSNIRTAFSASAEGMKYPG